jgi:lipopolysaccharide assembly outer membrane protein LptD (OstA)
LLAWPANAQREQGREPRQDDLQDSAERLRELQELTEEEGAEDEEQEGVEPVEEEPEEDRIVYRLPLPPEKGGGTVTGSADSVNFLRDTYVVLEGDVEISHGIQTISAERLELDLETMVVIAVGNVVLDEGPSRITGESMVWDLETSTGTLSEATAYMAPEMYFQGETIERVGEDTYTVSKARFSSCPSDVPLWSFGTSKARIRMEGYAKASNVTMRGGKVPFLYIPYFLYPAKRERTSGLLMPNFSYTESRGYSLGLSYFQTLGKSYDATFYVDAFTEDYLGLGTEFRYAPTPDSRGNIQGYFVDDPNSEDTRWKVSWNHLSERLPWGLRAAVTYVNFSDFQFFRDFDRDLNRITIRSLYSTANLAGAWGSHSVNLLVDDREVLSSSADQNNLVQNQLPELEYRMRQTQIGGLPLYFQMRSGAHHFNVQRKPALDLQYSRLYAFPSFTVPFGSLPWLNINFSATGRYTHYTDSKIAQLPEPIVPPEDEDFGEGDEGDAGDGDGDGDGEDAGDGDGDGDGDGEGEEEIVAEDPFAGGSLDRFLPSLGAQIVGPSFSRVFEGGVKGFAKYKHVIEPRWTYQFSEPFEDQNLVLLFDEIDRVQGLHRGTINLVNRLVAKPQEDVDDPLGAAAREIMSLEIGQTYSFDKDQALQVSLDGEIRKQSSPIIARYRYNPSLATSLQYQAGYSTIYSRFLNHTVSSQFFFGAPRTVSFGAKKKKKKFTQGLGRHNIGVSWRVQNRPDTGEIQVNQAGIASGFNFGRYLFQASLNLDFGPKNMTDRPTIQQQRYTIQRAGQCTSWRLEFWEYQTSTFEDRQVRFSVSLRNIGTFLDFGTGSDLSGDQRSYNY